MQVTINKGGKENKFTLINSWQDVTLETYAELIKYKKKSNTDEAYTLINSMSDIPRKFVQSLSLKDVTELLSNMANLQVLEDSGLKGIIRVGKKNYGFHPNLDEITMGEYADLEHFIEDGYINHLPEIMAVLYRPVVSRDGDNYTIEAYDGNIEERAKLFRNMRASEVQNALVFFWDFGSELLLTLQSYLMKTKLMKKELNSMATLPTSGAGLE
ncbi:MAG: hypothetical protein Unbinned3904contig1002_33 [Prokaryotic dsDNA virus sp.]|nr:MAG: hypothetical protein Unbinned3904contig1002_33 [Prokaryotic dsDNA virus sp.]|tara:strand:- start:983 stop:1624 length:642 start_codon:yes stop_codon:yes gene_type:complete